MRRASQIKSDSARYDYRPLLDDKKKRLNLNNLLRRMKDEEKKNKKFNLLIFSGTISVVLVFLLLLSL